MHSNVTIKNVSWPHFSWPTLYMPQSLYVAIWDGDVAISLRQDVKCRMSCHCLFALRGQLFGFVVRRRVNTVVSGVFCFCKEVMEVTV